MREIILYLVSAALSLIQSLDKFDSGIFLYESSHYKGIV
jgi:hypothetical protein